jgi:CRP/FNR family transcriptional regulator, cyclic AMP receptor protein
MVAPYGIELRENCKTCSWRGSSFFCDVSLAGMRLFEAVRRTSSLPGGAVLFVEDQIPRGVFLLCKGLVKLTMTSRDGNSIILRTAEPGEIIGLGSNMSGTPHELTAETVEPSQVNFIKRDAFLQLIHENAEFAIKVTEQLRVDYVAACVQIRSIGLSRSALEKTVQFLLRWADKGHQTNAGIRFNLPFTHEEIGQNVGVARETISRTLAHLKEKTLITMKGPTVVICNKPGLEALLAA